MQLHKIKMSQIALNERIQRALEQGQLQGPPMANEDFATKSLSRVIMASQ